MGYYVMGAVMGDVRGQAMRLVVVLMIGDGCTDRVGGDYGSQLFSEIIV
jgi:hypothetical protein